MKLSDKMKKWLIFILIGSACAYGTVTLYAMKPDSDAEPAQPPAPKQVTVRSVSPGTYPVSVKSHGEVMARWSTTVRTQVGGRIIRISDALQPGRRLLKGEVILDLEKTNYKAMLAQAMLELEDARVNLIQFERQASQARADWENSGIRQPPASPLVFFEPQLKAARARVAYARKNVEKAHNDLNHTRVVSPYAGLVAERYASRGETLFSGDQIIKLVSADQVEVRIGLDAAQVQQMGDWQSCMVRITDPATGRTWDGKIARDGGLVGRKTRLRYFYIIPVREPDSPVHDRLVPGLFVSVSIHGQSRKDLLAVPESSLTRDGEIWFVDRENRLQRHLATPVFYENGYVYITNELGAADLMVVASPSSGFIPGIRVHPELRGES